jgi:hypothetical protein
MRFKIINKRFAPPAREKQPLRLLALLRNLGGFVRSQIPFARLAK